MEKEEKTEIISREEYIANREKKHLNELKGQEKKKNLISMLEIRKMRIFIQLLRGRNEILINNKRVTKHDYYYYPRRR